jgi:hypothetical protein
MPMTANLVAADGRIEVTAVGDVSYAERLESLEEVKQLLRTHGRLPVLVELRGSAPVLTGQEVAALARTIGDAAPLFAAGIAVVAREGLQYGLTRMLQIQAEGSPVAIAVFTDRDAALAWLAARLAG